MEGSQAQSTTKSGGTWGDPFSINQKLTLLLIGHYDFGNEENVDRQNADK